LKINKANQSHAALTILDRGIKGSPEKVDHEEGLRIMQVAKQIGMELVGPVQIAKLGYSLKPNATPMIRKYRPLYNNYVNLYDLNSQCEKVEENII
jgi:hypothetical protein